MAAGDANKIFRTPGIVVANPSNLAGDPPYGGTQLGTVQFGRLRPIERFDEVVAEEYGGETTEIVLRGRDYVCTALVRQWDNDAIQRFFRSTAAGSSGTRVISEPADEAGDLGTGIAISVLFAPNDPRHPAWLLPRAVPLIQEAAELQASIVSEFNLAVVFRALRDANGYAVRIGLRGDL